MKSAPILPRAGVLLALLVILAPSGAFAIPNPEELARTDAPERIARLLSLGLARDAERELRADLSDGRESGRASLVRLLLRGGRADEAAALVEEWGGPGTLGTAANRFTAGRIEELRDNWTAAAAEYERSAVEEPLLADHAAYRAAVNLRRAGERARALELFEAAGAAARGHTLSARAYWEAAGLALAAGETDRALGDLERVPRRSVIDRADLLELEAKIHRAVGNAEREARALRDLLDRSPGSSRAIAAIERLQKLETPTPRDRLAFAQAGLRNRHATMAEREARQALRDLGDDPDPELAGRAQLRIGKALLARRQYTEAREELAKMRADADTSDRAEAVLDRARCLWRLGQIDACLAEYDRVADGDWPASVRATASWEAGREAKDNRRWEEAASRLGEFQRLFPEDDYADDAAWHRGRALTELGRTEEALAALDLLRIRYPESRFVPEATYWKATLLRDAGDREAECREYAFLLSDHADSYWAERARVRLGLEACPAVGAPDDTAAPEGEDALQWLARNVPGVDPDDALRRAAALRESDRFLRARTLASTDLVSEAETELGGLRRSLEKDSAGLLAFAQEAWLVGVPREAMRAVLVIKARTGKPVLSGELPPSVARLLYPVDHLDVVLQWAEEYEVDPWFVFAVMREESWFDHRAVSWAGAHGLMQIMPSTGRDLARRVGLSGFENSQLFRPEVNIRLGTYYLSELIDDLEREPALALSAYNAGKGNALRWRKNVDGEFDVDRYVAGITYRETYGYVQRVTRTWAIYRQLYDGLLESLESASGRN